MLQPGLEEARQHVLECLRRWMAEHGLPEEAGALEGKSLEMMQLASLMSLQFEEQRYENLCTLELRHTWAWRLLSRWRSCRWLPWRLRLWQRHAGSSSRVHPYTPHTFAPLINHTLTQFRSIFIY